MTLVARQSTFEFAQNLLASSRLFRDEVLGEYSQELGRALNESDAREHIYRQEALDEQNADGEGEHCPNLSTMLYPIPRAIIIQQTNDRRFVGTGSWAGSGELLMVIEALVPDEIAADPAHDSPTLQAKKFGERNAYFEQLAEQIRWQMLANKGKNDGAGNLYLAAQEINISEQPAESQDEEPREFYGWEYTVTWL